MISTEHARLKDHIASMTGGLEAKINEGFVFPILRPNCLLLLPYPALIHFFMPSAGTYISIFPGQSPVPVPYC